jgi:hypothetical protein
MGFFTICFPICFPISPFWGNKGETNGKTFCRFCVDLRDFAFHLYFSQSFKTSLFIGFSTILRRFPPFAYVELEGVERKKWNTFVYRSFTAVC